MVFIQLGPDRIKAQGMIAIANRARKIGIKFGQRNNIDKEADSRRKDQLFLFPNRHLESNKQIYLKLK